VSLFNDKGEIELLREGGRRLARILRLVGEMARKGARTDELNMLAEKLIRENGDTPSLLGYLPPFANRRYPSSICISVNDVVVHGIPTEKPITLLEGDIVGLDLVVTHGGFITDAAITVPVGQVDATAERLISSTREALYKGIEAARPRNHIGDIGYAIETYATERGFSVVEELCGHGVGRRVHEDLQIPNFGKPGDGEEIVSGMVLALEPMLNEGSKDVTLDKDGYTFRTKDGKRSAHFEHTILVTDNGPEIMTKE